MATSACVARTEEFGTKAEVKNVNSFRLFVKRWVRNRAAIGVIESGGRSQETRLYNPSSEGKTYGMRSKERPTTTGFSGFASAGCRFKVAGTAMHFPNFPKRQRMVGDAESWAGRRWCSPSQAWRTSSSAAKA